MDPSRFVLSDHQWQRVALLCPGDKAAHRCIRFAAHLWYDTAQASSGDIAVRCIAG